MVGGVGELARIEAAQERERRVGEVALKIARDPRDMSEIAALAVTFRQSGKDAEDLRVTLGAKRRIERTELIARKMRTLRISGGTVASELVTFKRFRNVEPRVLEKRYEVVGKRASQRILEVEQSHALHAFPVGQPHQVRRVVIAQHPAGILI